LAERNKIEKMGIVKGLGHEAEDNISGRGGIFTIVNLKTRGNSKQQFNLVCRYKLRKLV
jgi:hypothetical protein